MWELGRPRPQQHPGDPACPGCPKLGLGGQKGHGTAPQRAAAPLQAPGWQHPSKKTPGAPEPCPACLQTPPPMPFKALHPATGRWLAGEEAISAGMSI